MPQPKRVLFQGQEYWLDDELISPIDHLDSEGNYLGGPDEISYAIVQGSNVMRYGKIIGTEAELIEIPVIDVGSEFVQ